MKKNYVAGVDIGGQTAKIGIVDKKGNILARKVISTKYKDAGKFISLLSDSIREMTEDIGLDNINGVGVGAPDGNYYTGDIVEATNLMWAKGKTVHFANELSKMLGGLKVTITNDANAAAIGEMKYGAAKGMKNFIEITLGTGVGSGIVVDGKLVYGHDGFAGELGHTCAVKGGRQCGCGQKGCLECYCSATGVARTAVEMLAKTKTKSLLHGMKDITSKDVFDAAEKGDKLALKIFEYTGKIMGEKFADFIPFSAPEAIILFGGLTHAKDYFMKYLVDTMNEKVVFLWKGKVKVLVSALNESDAAILGASALAW
ncbi:MAG: ROK family protein [Bacteroidales bacterium]|nr:ROK family protein [Bacteroidales bacterium]